MTRGQSGPIVVCYGGGTDSSAMLIGMKHNGMRPDLILKAEPGAESPRIAQNTERMSAWCVANGFPPIVTVSQVTKAGEFVALDQQCLDTKSLPSIAYGYKGCSQKMKRYPQDKYVNNWEPAKAAWAAGLKVVKLIGYESGEEGRATMTEDSKYEYRYPLIQWDWDRTRCEMVIAAAGLAPFGKSSCYMCPSMTDREVMEMHAQEPELFWRAISLEDNADLTTVKGLGRRFSWRERYAGGHDSFLLQPPQHARPMQCDDGGCGT